MNAFEEQASTAIPVAIGGREYRFCPLRYGDHADAARLMRKEWIDADAVVRRIGKRLPREMQRDLLRLAYHDERRGGMVTLDDLHSWYRTPNGRLTQFWLSLRRHHPELSREDVDELITQAAEDEAAATERAASEALAMPRGNPLAPPGTAAHDPATPGAASSANSAGATAGLQVKSAT